MTVPTYFWVCLKDLGPGKHDTIILTCWLMNMFRAVGIPKIEIASRSSQVQPFWLDVQGRTPAVRKNGTQDT